MTDDGYLSERHTDEHGHSTGRRSDRLPEAATRPTLTDRQRQVLWCLSQGLQAKQTAARLHIEPATVQVHLAEACKALGVTKSCHAACQALRAGIID